MTECSPTADARARVPLAAERAWLEALHARWHHRRFVAPDPLAFVLEIEVMRNRELVALMASSLAYGNVTAMSKAIETVLWAIGPAPAVTLAGASLRSVSARLRGFRYRFTDGPQIASLLVAASRLAGEAGSLGAALEAEIAPSDDTVLPALERWTDALHARSRHALDHLLPRPSAGSACKRLHLMLRWLVRRDEVDPGGWEGVGRHRLIMPLDTHVFRVARERGWTDRRTPDLPAALEVTAFLRRVRPDDPLRYDFAITRPGIRGSARRPAQA